jgi:hypothetical protein
MTDTFVKEQIRVIEEATKAASQSKETALRFLEEAGIIKKANGSQPTSNSQTHISTKK